MREINDLDLEFPFDQLYKAQVSRQPSYWTPSLIFTHPGPILGPLDMMDQEVPQHVQIFRAPRLSFTKLRLKILASFPYFRRGITALEEYVIQASLFWRTFAIMQVAADTMILVRQIVDRTGSGGAWLGGVLPGLKILRV